MADAAARFSRLANGLHLFQKWKQTGLWPQLHETFQRALRLLSGRHEEPSAAILDSQSVKTAGNAEDKGDDAEKKVMGRKRHILADTFGLIIAVVVHSAGVQDYNGAQSVLEQVRGKRPRLKWNEHSDGSGS